MNEDGTIRPGQEVPARYQDKEAVLEAYKCMVKLENLDKVFYDAQRQVRCFMAVSCVDTISSSLLFLFLSSGPHFFLHAKCRGGRHSHWQRFSVGRW